MDEREKALMRAMALGCRSSAHMSGNLAALTLVILRDLSAGNAPDEGHLDLAAQAVAGVSACVDILRATMAIYRDSGMDPSPPLIDFQRVEDLVRMIDACSPAIKVPKLEGFH